MKINNKEFQEWKEDDLQILLHNEVYRENNFIDYKVGFAFLECTDKKQKKEKQAEFRNDVCSFANADGGYIFFGIGEDSGMAGVLKGISISNLDRFELDRRNELQSIQPVMPEVEFSFILLQDDVTQKQDNDIKAQVKKYVVALYIHQGFYKPYITEEQVGKFNFFTRSGNKKQAMTYTEMRNNFLNSTMLSRTIKEFRTERMEEYVEKMKGPFALMHLVPASFGNVADYLPMFEMYNQGKLKFDDFFNGMYFGRAVPNVDGVYFPDYSEAHDYEMLQIFNNGSVELKMDLRIEETRNAEHYLVSSYFFDEVRKLIWGTAEMYKKLGRSATIYVCATIVGCKGMWNYISNKGVANTKVDRNKIMCLPVEISNILDEEQVEIGIEECIQMTKYSLGITN